LHGLARQVTGFSVNEEIAEFRALRASVVRLWTDSLSPVEKISSHVFDQVQRFHEAIDQALAESVEAFSAEKAQRDHLYNTLLSASPDLHFVLDRDGRFLYANQALCGVHDILPPDMIGKTLSELGSPVAAEFQPYFEQVVATRKAHRGDVSYRLPEGQEATYECILVPVIHAEGQVGTVAGTARDMTERKRLEKDLLRQKTLADAIIESAPSDFFLLDEHSHLVRWNQNLCHETGLTDEQLRHASILAAILEEDRPLAAVKFLSAFATGYARMEVRLVTRNNRVRHHLKTVRRFLLDGKPFLAGFGIDITERKLSEEALAREKVFSDQLI